MLPAKNLPVASPLIPLTWTHSLGSSRRNSLPPELTASGWRAGAYGARARGGLPAAAGLSDADP